MGVFAGFGIWECFAVQGFRNRHCGCGRCLRLLAYGDISDGAADRKGDLPTHSPPLQEGRLHTPRIIVENPSNRN